MGTVGGVRIGVLGGIGPEASAEFYFKLIDRLQKTGLIRSNVDFPQIIINSIPAPELTEDKINDNDLEPYLSGLKELDKMGVDFIIMVCNTIHLYYEKLQKEVSVPIIDLRQELRNKILRENVKSVLIIGTPNTIKRGLYRFDEVKCFEPNEEEIEELSRAIFNFNKGLDKEMQIEKVREICGKYLKSGAEKVILGCTEFAVMFKESQMPKIDTIDVLVETVLDRFITLSEHKVR